MNIKRIFILSGPSGAGEDSIIEEIKKELDIEKIVTTTTRKIRKGEIDGKDYYFISKEEFENGIKEEKFAEYAIEYNNNYYGVTHAELERVSNCGRIGIWKIEYKGVITAKQQYPGIKAILITVPDLKILEDRIRRRDHVTDEYIQERMEYTKEWLSNAHIYDYTVVNHEGKLAEAVKEVKEIIKNLT